MRNIPCRLQAFVGDPHFGSGVALEQIEGDAPQDGKVLRGIAAPDAAIVFPESHVEHPVHAVFDAPVRQYRLTQQCRFRRQAADAITVLPAAGEAGRIRERSATLINERGGRDGLGSTPPLCRSCCQLAAGFL